MLKNLPKHWLQRIPSHFKVDVMHVSNSFQEAHTYIYIYMFMYMEFGSSTGHRRFAFCGREVVTKFLSVILGHKHTLFLFFNSQWIEFIQYLLDPDF